MEPNRSSALSTENPGSETRAWHQTWWGLLAIALGVMALITAIIYLLL